MRHVEPWTIFWLFFLARRQRGKKSVCIWDHPVYYSHIVTAWRQRGENLCAFGILLYTIPHNVKSYTWFCHQNFQQLGSTVVLDHWGTYLLNMLTAIATVVTMAEILKNNGFAVKTRTFFIAPHYKIMPVPAENKHYTYICLKALYWEPAFYGTNFI